MGAWTALFAFFFSFFLPSIPLLLFPPGRVPPPPRTPDGRRAAHHVWRRAAAPTLAWDRAASSGEGREGVTVLSLIEKQLAQAGQLSLFPHTPPASHPTHLSHPHTAPTQRGLESAPGPALAWWRRWRRIPALPPRSGSASGAGQGCLGLSGAAAAPPPASLPAARLGRPPAPPARRVGRRWRWCPSWPTFRPRRRWARVEQRQLHAWWRPRRPRWWPRRPGPTAPLPQTPRRGRRHTGTPTPRQGRPASWRRRGHPPTRSPATPTPTPSTTPPTHRGRAGRRGTVAGRPATALAVRSRDGSERRRKGRARDGRHHQRRRLPVTRPGRRPGGPARVGCRPHRRHGRGGLGRRGGWRRRQGRS